MDKEVLDLCTDYLISSFGQITATVCRSSGVLRKEHRPSAQLAKMGKMSRSGDAQCGRWHNRVWAAQRRTNMGTKQPGPRKAIVGTAMHNMFHPYPGLQVRLAKLASLVDQMA